MSTFNHLDELSPYRIWDQAVARAVRSDRITFAVVDVEPNAVVPEHRHENDQIGIVLKGAITMTVDGESRTLEAGGTYVIPGNVPHSAVSGPEGCTVVDVFSPTRDDWETVDRLRPSRGAWPS